MKIFLDNLLLTNKGGIYIYFQELFKFLNNKKCSYHVDFFGKPSQPIYPSNYSIKKKRFLERLRKCYVPSSFDIFHSSYYRLPKNKNIKVVTTVHDFTHQKFLSGYKSYLNMYIKMRAIRRSDAIICISKNTKKDLLSYYRPKKNQKLKVIYNGISSDYQKKYPKDFNYKKFFLYVGHRVDYKNWNIALELLKAQKDFNLVVVGGDPNKDKFFQNIHENLKERIIFHGFITNEALNDLYNEAFCLFYPSSYEGFGIPVIEAMAAGCPVIANDECEAIKEIAGNKPLYFNVKKANFSEVFDSLKIIDREEIINQGLQHALNFSWDANFSEVYKVYKSLMYND
jgi:mannosyltransferase